MREVNVRLNCIPLEWTLLQYAWCPYKKGKNIGASDHTVSGLGYLPCKHLTQVWYPTSQIVPWCPPGVILEHRAWSKTWAAKCDSKIKKCMCGKNVDSETNMHQGSRYKDEWWHCLQVKMLKLQEARREIWNPFTVLRGNQLATLMLG